MNADHNGKLQIFLWQFFFHTLINEKCVCVCLCVSNCGLKWEMGWQSGVPISRARSHAPQASRANKTDQSAATAPGGGGGHHNEPHDGVHSTQSRGEEESQAWKRPIVGPSV